MSMESSKRSALLATNVRPEAKEAITSAAKDLGTSVSALMSDWVEEKLEELGYGVPEPLGDEPEDETV